MPDFSQALNATQPQYGAKPVKSVTFNPTAEVLTFVTANERMATESALDRATAHLQSVHAARSQWLKAELNASHQQALLLRSKAAEVAEARDNAYAAAREQSCKYVQLRAFEEVDTQTLSECRTLLREQWNSYEQQRVICNDVFRRLHLATETHNRLPDVARSIYDNPLAAARQQVQQISASLDEMRDERSTTSTHWVGDEVISLDQFEEELLLEWDTGSHLDTWMSSAIHLNADDWHFIASDSGYLPEQEVDSEELIACDMAAGVPYWSPFGSMD